MIGSEIIYETSVTPVSKVAVQLRKYNHLETQTVHNGDHKLSSSKSAGEIAGDCGLRTSVALIHL